MDLLLRYFRWTDRHPLLTPCVLALGYVLLAAYAFFLSISPWLGWTFFIAILVALLYWARKVDGAGHE